MGQKQSRTNGANSSSNLAEVEKNPACSPHIFYYLPPGPYHIYNTHCNGGRVFRVHVDQVRRMAFITTIFADPYPASCPPLFNRYFRYERVWIGKSEKSDVTENGKAYGGTFDGNSVLFALDEANDTYNTYLFAGCSLRGFSTKAPLVSFKSPIANNDVPCPYAVSALGSYYLPETGEVVTPPKGAAVSEYEIVHSPSRPPGTTEKKLHFLFSYTPTDLSL